MFVECLSLYEDPVYYIIVWKIFNFNWNPVFARDTKSAACCSSKIKCALQHVGLYFFLYPGCKPDDGTTENVFDLSDQKLKEYDLKNNIDHIDMCAERVHDYNEEGRLNERSFLIPNIRFILDKLSTSPSSIFWPTNV